MGSGTQSQERIALVTGASAGIGRAIAVRLSELGMRLVLNARREDRLRELKNELSHAPSALVVGDACDEMVLEQCFATAREKWGAEPDCVVVNAGRGLGGALRDVDLKKFEEILKLNVFAATQLIQRAARSMSAPGMKALEKPRDIIVLGSISGRHISPFSAVYGATKFAISGLTEAVRRELAPHGVRVSLLEPAIVLSEFQEGAGYTEEWHRNVDEKFGPLLLPDDIARIVAFQISQPAHVHLSNVVIRPTRQDYP